MSIHRSMSEARTSIEERTVQFWFKGWYSAPWSCQRFSLDLLSWPWGREAWPKMRYSELCPCTHHVPIIYLSYTCHIVIVMSTFHARMICFCFSEDCVEICGLYRHIREVPLILTVFCMHWNPVQSLWCLVLKSFSLVHHTCSPNLLCAGISRSYRSFILCLFGICWVCCQTFPMNCRYCLLHRSRRTVW